MCKGIKIVWLGCWKQPKLAQKWPKNCHFSTFFDFLKNCLYDSNEIFYSHSTPYYGPLCAISLNSYGWDVRNIAKFSPKMAKKVFSIFSIFSQTVHTVRTKASQKGKDLSRLLYRICGSGFKLLSGGDGWRLQFYEQVKRQVLFIGLSLLEDHHG